MPISPRMSGNTGAEPPVRIRPASAADEPAIRACAEAAYALYVPRIGRRPAPMEADFARHIRDGDAWVLELDDGLAGYAVFYGRGDHLHLENVAVLPERKGRGFGRALLRFVELEARRRNLAAVELYTNAQMTENIGLYSRLGYAETARGIENGFSRVYFRKATG